MSLAALRRPSISPNSILGSRGICPPPHRVKIGPLADRIPLQRHRRRAYDERISSREVTPHFTTEDVMLNISKCVRLLVGIVAVAALLTVPLGHAPALAADEKGKVKVLYHVDGKDPEVAKYALALI